MRSSGSVAARSRRCRRATQLTREIGIRMALGAEHRAVGGIFLHQGLVLVSIGMAFGLVAGVALTRFMTVLLFGITPLDPATHGAVCLVLAAAAAAPLIEQ